MTEPVKTTMIGGVKYAEGQVKSSRETQEIYSDAQGNLKSRTIFEVELANGTKLNYREQAPEREATVVQDKSWTNLFGLESAKITDTPADDKYILAGCIHCKVEANRSHKEGIIFEDIIGEDKDYIYIKHRVMNDGSAQVAKLNLVNTNPGDIFQDETKKTGKYYNRRM